MDTPDSCCAWHDIVEPMAAEGDTAFNDLLKSDSGNDPQSAAELLPLVYEELRTLARQRMRAERPDHTLQATALVHEAFKKLAGGAIEWKGRSHFFFAAASAMRAILIDHARARNSEKRGGSVKRSVLEIMNVADLAADTPGDVILALDAAICRLSTVDSFAEQVVRLRFFAGLTNDQASEALECSPRTVKRGWEFARAWLAREMEQA